MWFAFRLRILSTSSLLLANLTIYLYNHHDDYILNTTHYKPPDCIKQVPNGALVPHFYSFLKYVSCITYSEFWPVKIVFAWTGRFSARLQKPIEKIVKRDGKRCEKFDTIFYRKIERFNNVRIEFVLTKSRSRTEKK